LSSLTYRAIVRIQRTDDHKVATTASVHFQASDWLAALHIATDKVQDLQTRLNNNEFKIATMLGEFHGSILCRLSDLVECAA
jgi:hypothetical protein